MGNSISCHQPCCRWTTDVEGELAVDGAKRLGKHGEEEPKMNFDTNVIGPSNINLIGGGSGLQLQQELKLFEESRFSRQPRDNSRGKSSSPTKAKLEEEDPLPVAKATFDRNPKNRASRPSGPSEPSSGRSTSPLTQSAKQFADTFSKAKVEANVTNRNPKPAKARFQETIRMMPTSAWSKLYARFPTELKTPKVATVAAGAGAIAPPESVLVQTKALHSIVPAQWSSFHRHWTCQKKVAEMAIPAILLPNSDAVVTVASASLVKIAKAAVCKEISTVLSSVSPAMWSPLHRKWCGNEGLKSSKVAVAGAMQKLVVAKDYGLLPGLASSMLNAALNIEVKVQQVQPIEDLKEVSKSVIVKCSVTPAVYSKWHRHWTGGKAR